VVGDLVKFRAGKGKLSVEISVLTILFIERVAVSFLFMSVVGNANYNRVFVFPKSREFMADLVVDVIFVLLNKAGVSGFHWFIFLCWVRVEVLLLILHK